MLTTLLRFVRFRQGASPSFVVDLYAKYCRNIYLFCFALSVCRQLFVETILCQNQDAPKLSSLYTNTRCYLNGTTTRYPDEPLNHNYYQWVPVVLLLAAFHVHFPLQVWSRMFDKNVRFLRGAKDEQSIEVVLEAIQQSRFLFFKTWMLEWFYLAHLCFGAWMLDVFFKHVWSDNNYSALLAVTRLFPDHGYCNLPYFNGGDTTDLQLTCLLPLNSVYRKVFVVIFESFKIMLVLHGLFLLHRFWLLTCIGPRLVEISWAGRVAIDSAESWNAKRDIEACLDRQTRNRSNWSKWSREEWLPLQRRTVESQTEAGNS